VAPVSIQPFETAVMEIFPNPASEYIHVVVSERQQKGVTYITDMLGNKIFSKSIDGNKYSFDVRNYPNGVYFITHESLGSKTIQKIILAH
jgi:hypothetical protein